MMRRRWFQVLICVVAVGCGLLWVAMVRAQHTSRNLTGLVTDRQHEPLRGAVVQVHCEATGTVVSYITDKTGQYVFLRLDGDADFTVWATWQGRRSASKKLSLFDSKTDKVINLEIDN